MGSLHPSKKQQLPYRNFVFHPNLSPRPSFERGNHRIIGYQKTRRFAVIFVAKTLFKVSFTKKSISQLLVYSSKSFSDQQQLSSDFKNSSHWRPQCHLKFLQPLLLKSFLKSSDPRDGRVRYYVFLPIWCSIFIGYKQFRTVNFPTTL